MKIFFSILFTLVVVFAQAQVQGRFSVDALHGQSEASSNTKPYQVPLRERFGKREYYRFGGNLGASFGNYAFVNVSPRVYFLPTDKLWTGAGFNFIYSKIKDYPSPFDESFTYGPSFLAMYELFSVANNAIFVQAEYEALNFEVVTKTGYDEYAESRVWGNNVLLGGAVNLSPGGVAVFVSVLYNVTYKDSFTNYYGSPWVFRMGVGF